jgi:putative oxidoreductase
MSSLFNSPTQRQVDIGLTILRVVLGVIFIAHGGQKLFVYGFAGVAGAFGQMGVPAAAFVGPAIALIEFFGGIALALGLLTRLAALGIGLTMIGAIVLVHLPAGFFAPNGIEFPLALLSAAATLVVTGAGKYSLDALIARRQPVAARTGGVQYPFRRAA